MALRVYWPAFAFTLFALAGCSASTSPSDSEIGTLNVTSGKALVLNADNALAQIGDRSSGNGTLAVGQAVQSVLDANGDSVSADFVVPVNSRYVFVKAFAKRGQSTRENHAVLDLTTGRHVRLKNWPLNPARIASTDATAFYISNAGLEAVELATGESQVVSAETKSWRHKMLANVLNYSDGQTEPWSAHARTWLYVDANTSVYAIDYQSTDNGRPIGVAGKFSLSGGAWLEDAVFHDAFPNMPAQLADQIPGALLLNSRWIVVDAESRALYRVEAANGVLELRPYDLNSFSAGSVVLSANLSHAISGTTFLGFNNYIQNSVMTDGQSLLRLQSSSGVLSVEEIAVPVSVPVENVVAANQPWAQYWPRNAVTNWNYIRNNLYFLNSVDGMVYSWDLDPSHVPTVVQNSEGLRFWY